jgi:DNA replication protein DnaC
MTGIGVPARHVDNFSRVAETPALADGREWPARGFLVLPGSPGSGKSFAAACAVRAYIERKVSNILDMGSWNEADRAAAGVSWQSVFELTAVPELLADAKRARLLVMDNFGEESDTRYAVTALRGVISARYDARLASVITTSLELRGIYERYGRFVSERLLEDSANGGRVIDFGDSRIRSELGKRSAEE